MTGALILLSFVTLQRLGELVLARRNTAALLAKGAHEVGAGHYGLIVAFHAVWLAGLWFFGWNATLHGGWLTLFLLLQMGRLWVLATLGDRWTTRIIVLPGTPLKAGGPYRFVRHPNYWVVAGEIAVLPLTLGLPLYALAFSLAHIGVLAVRIRAEDSAIRGERGTT